MIKFQYILIFLDSAFQSLAQTSIFLQDSQYENPIDLLVSILFGLDSPQTLSNIVSATLIPSTAADTMPPAYPAPSPDGYKLSVPIASNVFVSLGIRRGLDVLVSTAWSKPSSW